MQFPYDGARQIVIPQPIRLATLTGASLLAATPSVEFRVQTPDSRLQTKVSVMFVPNSFSFPFDMSGGLSEYYLFAEDESYGAPFSGYIPLTAVVGTATVPVQLPLNPDLMGHSREFVTAADALHGILTLGEGEGGWPPGQWILQTRFQPYGLRIPDAEWDEITRQCNATLITPPINI